jgi:hypothetical protein
MKKSILILISGLTLLFGLSAQSKPLSAEQQAQIKKWPAACQKLMYTQTVTKEDILRCKAAGGIPR